LNKVLLTKTPLIALFLVLFSGAQRAGGMASLEAENREPLSLTAIQGKIFVNENLLAPGKTFDSQFGAEIIRWGEDAVMDLAKGGDTTRISPSEGGQLSLAQFARRWAPPPRGIRPTGFLWGHLAAATVWMLAASTLVALLFGRRNHGYVLPGFSALFFGLIGTAITWVFATLFPVHQGPWAWHSLTLFAGALWWVLLYKYLPKRDLTPRDEEMLSDLRIAGAFLHSRGPLSQDQLMVIERSTLPEAVKRRIRVAIDRRQASAGRVSVKKG
jgi:hypothetical protein